MTSKTLTIYCDGGARNNPGVAGIGFEMLQDDAEILTAGAYIGETTNNVAEYCGFIWALENARELGAHELEVLTDSSLMVKQLMGEFKVKDTKLKRLHAYAHDRMNEFTSVTIDHVFREENERADEFANQAMDIKGTVGSFKVGPTQVQQLVADLNATLFDAANPKEAPTEKPAPPAKTGNGVYSLQVKWHFDAAHRLYDYPGECADLHGHTWDVEVTIEADQLNEIGILYDFKDLKADLKLVTDRYDHKLINDIAPFDTISPTAENLARVIYEDLQKVVGTGIRVAEVGVWESPVARVGYRTE